MSSGPLEVLHRIANSGDLTSHDGHAMNEAIAQVEALVKDWPDTYAAFKGAFDTPVAWKRIGGEYADDARQRLRQFDEALKPLTPESPSSGLVSEGGDGR